MQPSERQWRQYPRARLRHLPHARPRCAAHRAAGPEARLSPHRYGAGLPQRSRSRRSNPGIRHRSAAISSSPPRSGSTTTRHDDFLASVDREPEEAADRLCRSAASALAAAATYRLLSRSTRSTRCSRPARCRHIGVSNFNTAPDGRRPPEAQRGAAGHQPDRIPPLSRPVRRCWTLPDATRHVGHRLSTRWPTASVPNGIRCLNEISQPNTARPPPRSRCAG